MDGKENAVLDQIFEMEILMDLHVLRTPESENHILSCWSMCVSVSSFKFFRLQ